MSTFNKIYKKVANNGNDNDYQMIAQVGTDGVPLDVYKYNGSTGNSVSGLIPKYDGNDYEESYLTSGGWYPCTGTSYMYNENDIEIKLNFPGPKTVMKIGLPSYDLNTKKGDKIGILNKSLYNKLQNLQNGLGVEYKPTATKLGHWYGNSQISVTRYNAPSNLPAFTSGDILDSSFIQKLSNNQIKFLKDGLYIVELRYSVGGPELTSKLDICPYINGTAQRYLAFSGGNDKVTNDINLRFNTFLIDVEAGNTFDLRAFATYDEITVKGQVYDIAITCIDSTTFFKVTGNTLSNRDRVDYV